MCYCPTPKHSPHRRLCISTPPPPPKKKKPKKIHSVWFISILNYGDIENVLINHLILVIPVIPCHYTNLCPHKPHKHTHTHTHTHTHMSTNTHTHACTHTSTHRHSHTDTHTHTYTDTHTHAHTHTHSLFLHRVKSLVRSQVKSGCWVTWMKAWIHDWCGRWVTRLNNLSVALPTMHCYTAFVFVSLGSISKATHILSTLSKKARCQFISGLFYDIATVTRFVRRKEADRVGSWRRVIY